MQRGQVGQIQTQRMPGVPRFAADYAAFLAWARATWDARDADYRISFRADRNLHWFMDSPVYTHPELQAGLHPGDNFVHKPESGDPALLRRLGVRYLVSTSNMLPSGATAWPSSGRSTCSRSPTPSPSPTSRAAASSRSSSPPSPATVCASASAA
ncbi:hypothetical protein [Nannocystis sp.]|uniref:hypothetical protein n=1 Tax=Nannocystis sp. TaxID=1962667 RepID=UPI0025EAC31B|nr:hypothetical protein [Nannocystis sp.]MBK7826496.1 hypothetical protein [Nannocystis sp.]